MNKLNINKNENINQQINIKRNRSKKFTTKKRPYKTYNDAIWKWNDVFIEIDNLKLLGVHNFFINIATKFGIVLSTLRNKYYDYNNNKIIIDNKEHRGGSNKIFNKEQELGILDIPN